MTELLFYTDTDIHTFNAEVITAEITEKGLLVILDKTAFYPEGGGQPADRGTLAGLQVIDVQKKDDIVSHYLQMPENTGTEKTAVPAAGMTIEGNIDADYRRDYMEQHSGQHIISAAMMRAADIQTVSVRQGSDFTAIETSVSELSPETVRLIEEEANSYIRMKAPIIRHITDAEGLKYFKLRRPSKHSINIKIIDIPEVDCVACGGMHLKTTADIGLVKYIYQEKIRGHVRTFWKIGKRAYDDYAEKTGIINNLSEFYSARQFELLEKAEAAAQQFTESRYRYNKLEEEHAALYASILSAETGGAVIKTFEGRTKGFITGLIKSLSSNHLSGPSFIFNSNDGVMTWAVTCPDEADFDFNSFKNDFLPIIDGKGGGKPPFWQGIAKNPDGIELLLGKLRERWPTV